MRYLQLKKPTFFRPDDFMLATNFNSADTKLHLALTNSQ